MKFELPYPKIIARTSARFWSAPVLWRFSKDGSGRGLPQSKTLPR
jgi:hypothetical protein